MAERKTVVVTGASAGIGRAIARAFGKQGARVALLARGREGLDAACREIQDNGGEAMVVETDVADHNQVEVAAERVETAWGAIDVWVNNAMATIFCPFIDMEPADFRRATEVTYLGSVWGTLAALKRMMPRDQGVIIQVGSALAYRSIPLQSPYCGAKSALRGFTDSLRSELFHDKSAIRLTMVQLSAFNTPQFDWGRTCLPRQPQPVPPIFQPELAAEAVVWAAANPRREVWVGLPATQAIIGTRVIPGLLDRYLAQVAYTGQQTDQPVPGDRKDNLYSPVPGDHGAHGRFDAQAKTFSGQLWLVMHPWVVTIAAIVAVLVLGTGLALFG